MAFYVHWMEHFEFYLNLNYLTNKKSDFDLSRLFCYHQTKLKIYKELDKYWRIYLIH